MSGPVVRVIVADGGIIGGPRLAGVADKLKQADGAGAVLVQPEERPHEVLGTAGLNRIEVLTVYPQGLGNLVQQLPLGHTVVRFVLGNTVIHLSVLDFKKEQRAKEIAELEAVKAKKQGQVEQQEQRLKELTPAVKNMEQLAAQFSDDPERILPEPGPLESAKSYREKKAKPLLAQIVKVLRSVYRAYIELKGKYERLLGDYGRAREGNERLSDRLQEVKLENKALRGTVADFERVKRAFGPEEVERAVEDAKRWEAQEREQKKAKRKFSRGAR